MTTTTTGPARPAVPACPNPTDTDAIRAWLTEHAPDVTAVRAWTTRLLARLEPTTGVPDLGSPAWVALADTDTRKLAAALRPALAHLSEQTPEAIETRLRSELDEFANRWVRAHKDASVDVSSFCCARGYHVGPSHAELERRRQLTTTTSCGACGRAVTVAHPVPDEYADRLDDLSWVHCEDCTRGAPLTTVRRRDAA